MLLVYYYNVVVINAALMIQIRDRFCDLDLLVFSLIYNNDAV